MEIDNARNRRPDRRSSDTRMITRNGLVTLVLALAVAILAGCASGPPTEGDADRNERTVTIITTDGGSSPQVGVTRVPIGAPFNADLVPDRGFVVASVLINDVPVGSSPRLEIDSVDRDYLIVVSFRPEIVCLVLSVGGADGLAHIGAIDALAELSVEIDCVFGNSMGALIGGLYASAPTQDLASRYRDLIERYSRESTDARVRSASTGGLVGGLALLLMSGGTFGWATVGGAIVGAVIGGTAEKSIDAERFQSTLDRYLEQMEVQDTDVPFAASYFRKHGSGLVLVVAREGNLARVLSRSASNPYIFENADIEFVDPGVDRIAVVPVQEAAATFRPDRIIAINVTGTPALFSVSRDIRVEEIPIAIDEHVDRTNALMGKNPDFELLYAAGYRAVREFYNSTHASPDLRVLSAD